jgi:hypothetical protein
VLYYALAAPVAQRIEQVTSNDKVVGSNPIGGAKKRWSETYDLAKLSMVDPVCQRIAKQRLKRLDDPRSRIDGAQQRLDGLTSPWSRFRNRDTIDTLHSDRDHAAGWVTEYETRAATLRPRSQC